MGRSPGCQAEVPKGGNMKGQLVEVRVEVNGTAIAEYQHGGDTYVVGKKNSNYTLRVVSHHWEPVAAIISVDGLNCITGLPVDKSKEAYVLEYGTPIHIPGWLVDAKTAAAFTFTDINDSYSVKQAKGRGEHIGRIHASFHFKKNEKPPEPEMPYIPEIPAIPDNPDTIKPVPIIYPLYPDAERTNKPWSPAPTWPHYPDWPYGPVFTMENNGKLGTGFGKSCQYSTVEKYMLFDEQPFNTMTIYYDTVKRLAAAGVLTSAKTITKKTQYCKPPENWKK